MHTGRSTSHRAPRLCTKYSCQMGRNHTFLLVCLEGSTDCTRRVHHSSGEFEQLSVISRHWQGSDSHLALSSRNTRSKVMQRFRSTVLAWLSYSVSRKGLRCLNNRHHRLFCPFWFLLNFCTQLEHSNNCKTACWPWELNGAACSHLSMFSADLSGPQCN